MRWSSLAVAVLVASLAGCGGGSGDKGVVELARDKFEQAKARGVDMRRGPCLGRIKAGWVADVAHEPRQPIDDLPQNQCAAYRSGKASHFVELDPTGRLIRTG